MLVLLFLLPFYNITFRIFLTHYQQVFIHENKYLSLYFQNKGRPSYLEVLGTEKSENPWIEQLTSRLLSQADWFLSPTALFFHRVGLIQNKWTIL